MKSINLSKFFNSALKLMSKNAPTILTTMAVIGVGGTVVLTVKCTQKAVKTIEESKRENKVEELTKKEVVKACWKDYIPVYLMAGATAGCIIGANAVNLKRSAALVAAYQLSQSALSEYKEAAKDVVGEEKSHEIMQKAAEKRLDSTPKNTKELYCTPNGKYLFYDYLSGRYFRSSMDIMKKAENLLNRQINTDMYASLNDLYDYLYNPDMGPIGLGDELGWNMCHGYVELEFSSQISNDGEPCIVMMVKDDPHFNYASL